MTLANDTLRTSMISYCALIGDNGMLVQGAGGNVSWKEDDTLWIKASGTWLAHAAEKDIFVPVDLPMLRHAVEQGNFSVTPVVTTASPLRPSIETLLHALMPQRVVVHVHAIEVLARLVRRNWQDDFAMLLGTTVQWAAVPYKKPGAELAEAVSFALSATPGANVVFLESHGVVIGGDNIAEVDATIVALTTALQTRPKQNVTHESVLPIILDDGTIYQPLTDPELHALATDVELFARVSTEWALYPDHVVFLGAVARTYPDVATLKAKLSGISDMPELVFIEGVGGFTKNDFSIAKQAQLRCYYDVLVRQPSGTSASRLDNAKIAELLNWDAEQYRMTLSKFL
ncbi:class II aldolase/adducin family protein [Janthinobacterium sp. MDB2-8]|uniref:class II aldolase/adducin family protein n=1 Tax=Janthinobacterium sp. MDB2-8 TaxID=1259338 RepID=UPI003F233D49